MFVLYTGVKIDTRGSYIADVLLKQYLVISRLIFIKECIPKGYVEISFFCC